MKTIMHKTLGLLIGGGLLLGGVMGVNAADDSARKMYFLVEMDHVKPVTSPTKEASREFVEQRIFPTLARGEKYVSEEKIVAGGSVAGRIALRFIVAADSLQEVDRIVESFPLWVVAETRVTPLIAFGDRRANVQILLDGYLAITPPPGK